MYSLRVMPPQGEPFDRLLEGDVLVIGRSAQADLPLADRFLSRRHARIFRRGEEWYVEDLGSRNGTFLNGEQLRAAAPIRPGDELRVSGSILRLVSPAEIGEPRRPPSSDLSQHTVFRPASDLIPDRISPDTGEIGSPEEISHLADRLRLLNDIHRALSRSIDLGELLDLILARAFEELEPEEGVIFLRDGEGSYRRAAQRSVPDLDRDYPYSQTLVTEVVEKGLAALVLDVESDERFSEAESILTSGVRSLVAAPLLDPEGSLGMIALNSRLHKRQFAEEDLELLASLASVAAMRIRNVELAEEAAERRRLEEELRLAREIQVALLPSRLPEFGGYEIHGGTVPSRGVSGDYYKVVERADGRECLLMVADVSGKGIAASLLTASLEALSAGPIDSGMTPEAICEVVNRRLFERTPPQKYATVVLAVLDPASGELTYTGAGHNPALLVRQDGRVERLSASGLPIGLLPESRYRSESKRLREGDCLVLYTDGITEAVGPGGEEYGIDRLESICREQRRETARRLASAIEKDISRFAAGVPYPDDRTLVILRRTGEAGG